MSMENVNGGVESRHAVTQRTRQVADRDSNWYSTLEPKKQTVPFAALAIAGVAPGPLTNLPGRASESPFAGYRLPPVCQPPVPRATGNKAKHRH